MEYTKEQYLEAMQGYFGCDEETSHDEWFLVKVRKDHECMGTEHEGDDTISTGDYALCEKAIHVDMGRVSAYVCLECANSWVKELRGE